MSSSLRKGLLIAALSLSAWACADEGLDDTEQSATGMSDDELRRGSRGNRHGKDRGHDGVRCDPAERDASPGTGEGPNVRDAAPPPPPPPKQDAGSGPAPLDAGSVTPPNDAGTPAPQDASAPPPPKDAGSPAPQDVSTPPPPPPPPTKDAGTPPAPTTQIRGSATKAMCSSVGAPSGGQCGSYYCGVKQADIAASLAADSLCPDVAAICEGRLVGALTNCTRSTVIANLGTAVDTLTPKIETCVYQDAEFKQKVSSACLGCFMKAATCAVNKCLTQCLSDGPACDSCRQKNNCDQPVFDCAKLPNPF